MASNINTIKLPKDKIFGLFIAFSCIFLYTYGYFFKDWSIKQLSFLAAVTVFFAFTSFAAPKILRPLNWLWYQIGTMLGKVVSPVVLGIIFFCILTPVSLLTRMFGRDALRLKKVVSSNTHWINRDPPGPEPESFKNQF